MGAYNFSSPAAYHMAAVPDAMDMDDSDVDMDMDDYVDVDFDVEMTSPPLSPIPVDMLASPLTSYSSYDVDEMDFTMSSNGQLSYGELEQAYMALLQDKTSLEQHAAERITQLEQKNDTLREDANQRITELEQENDILQKDALQRITQLEQENDNLRKETIQRIKALEDENNSLRLEGEKRIADLEQTVSGVKSQVNLAIQGLQQQNAQLQHLLWAQQIPLPTSPSQQQAAETPADAADNARPEAQFQAQTPNLGLERAHNDDDVFAASSKSPKAQDRAARVNEHLQPLAIVTKLQKERKGPLPSPSPSPSMFPQEGKEGEGEGEQLDKNDLQYLKQQMLLHRRSRSSESYPRIKRFGSRR